MKVYKMLSLSSGAKLVKYESRVAFELGLGTCSPDVWAISADVWAFLVTDSALSRKKSPTHQIQII